jgi:Glycosyl transferase family 21
MVRRKVISLHQCQSGACAGKVSLELTYVLPLRWDEERELGELTEYLERLSGFVELIVVDGSPTEVFKSHRSSWERFGVHVPPDPDLSFLNGKVDGVFTGVRRASHEAVVIADDDVRYAEDALRRVTALLQENELVRPQNYFAPMFWHARWDSARSLLNRAIGADFPGTLGFQKSFFMTMGGYDGDVMFENLELIRKIAAAGGREVAPLDLFVARIPPDSRGFWSQRVRQAYDDLAMPARLTVFLSVLPLVIVAVATRRTRWLIGAALVSVAAAEVGRKRGGGDKVFPASASLFAPLWLSERAVCSWLALGSRIVRGGVRYRTGTIKMAATPQRRLESRFQRGEAPAHPVP